MVTIIIYGILKFNMFWKSKRFINAEMEEPQAVEGNNNDAQFRHDLTAYNAWKKKDSTARGILISSMNDDLVYEYQQY